MVQAQSKRGSLKRSSQRLPRERSSEISKNYHKNSDSHSPIYMCVEINRAGVFGPKIFPFRTLTCNSHFPIYMRVEINRAGVFGPKIFPFRTLTCNSHFPSHMHTQQLLECIQLQLNYFEVINILWLPYSTPRLNSKILNLQNNHFGHLTSIKVKRVKQKLIRQSNKIA